MRRELQAAFHLQLSRQEGISAADYAVMVPLSDAPDGQLRTKDLGAALGWDRSRTSHQVTRMVKRGLVARDLYEDDARGSIVRLTPAGKASIEHAAPNHVALVRQLFFDPLSDDELDRPDIRGVGLFLGVGMHPEAVHRLLIDERVDAVGFHTETDPKRDIARPEGVDEPVDTVGGKGL